MKQISQNYKSGEMKIEEVPAPILKRGGALVQSCYSLISAGTEKSTIEISKKSLLGKAKARPDLVKKVISTAKKVGIRRTFDLVMNRLNTPVPLGYSLSGVVKDIADDVAGLKAGDLVACAGAGYANHAEVVFVPQNLMAKVPKGVSEREAAFTTVGSIALHGVRQAGVGVGDRVGVIGLGLVGQITLGLLKAQGCRVFGIDLNAYVVNFSEKMGVDVSTLRDDPLLGEKIYDFSDGVGLDAVIIAAGTDSNDPFELSAEILRDKGTLVVVGGIKMEIVKSVSSLFYLKEIDIKFSRSYGPGRYDTDYEEKGIDYPIGFVRWTEQRNMECFLDLLAARKLDVNSIITHSFPFERALEAYELVEGKSQDPYLGILLEYERDRGEEPLRLSVREKTTPVDGKIRVGMIGVGNFVQANVLPFLEKSSHVDLRGICDAQGMTARSIAEKAGFAYCASQATEIFADKEMDVVFIGTRHDSHAKYVIEALEAGKHVYVEKPLCLNSDELDEIIKAYALSVEKFNNTLMVGYNRRFAPLSAELKKFIGNGNGPLTVVYRVSAGFLPSDNWYQDPSQGGRFIGEGGHFVDFGQFLTDSQPVWVSTAGITRKNKPVLLTDDLVATVQMEDDSVLSVIYNSSGDTSMPKERIEVFTQNSSAVLDDFKSLKLFRGGKSKTQKIRAQDKGYKAEIEEYLKSIKDGSQAPISFESLVKTSLTTFAAIESLKSKIPVKIQKV